MRVLIEDALQDEYEKLVQNAPHRSKKSKKYFVKHSGEDSANDSNRHVEILAKALKQLDRSWAHPGGGRFRLLDYQFPLKAQESDQGIGKVDLLGVTDQGRLMAIELKVKPRRRQPWRDSNESTDGGTAVRCHCESQPRRNRAGSEGSFQRGNLSGASACADTCTKILVGSLVEPW